MFDSKGATDRDLSKPEQPLERLEAEICELAGHLTAGTCRFLQLLAEFDRREGWAQWDMPSCASWLSWKCGLSSGTAREHVRIARRLAELPAIRAEFAAGRLSFAKVRALTRIATPNNDADLAEMALPMTANQLERFSRAHKQVTAADAEHAAIRRRLTWRLEEDGSLSLTAHLPPEAGATVLTALRTAVVPDQPQKKAAATSTSLADALVEVAENYIAAKTRDAENPDVYQVIVHVDAGSLSGDDSPERRCHMDDGPAISPRTAQMFACDALISWMRHDARGNVLDVGRRHRNPPPALRRALRERDKGRCRFPGCDSRRIDAHHVRWWIRGGTTCLANLVSLCRRHHRLIHEFGYQVDALPDGGFTFLRPDGTPIPASPPSQPVRGHLHDLHDAEITATTIVPAWYGERLNLDYAIAVLFGNQDARRARAKRVSAETPARQEAA